MNTPREFQAHYAETSGRDALANARATMQRALEELDRYIARYDEAESLKDKANVLNWTLSHLATYVPNNVRLDLIAGAKPNWCAPTRWNKEPRAKRKKIE